MDTGRSFGRPQTRRSAELSSRHPSDSPISYSRQHSGSNTRSIYSGDESEAEQPGRQRSSRFDVSDDRTKSTNEPSHRGYPTHRREHRGDGYHEDTPFIPSTSVREDPSRRATTYGGRAAERGRYSGFRGRSPPRLVSPPSLPNTTDVLNLSFREPIRELSIAVIASLLLTTQKLTKVMARQSHKKAKIVG